MRRCVAIVAAAVTLIGCDAKVGSGANLPAVALYPGSKIVTNGENNGVIGANLETTDSEAQVVAFYEKELGAKQSAGAIKGSKNGHETTVIVTPAGPGKTAVSIIQPK